MYLVKYEGNTQGSDGLGRGSQGEGWYEGDMLDHLMGGPSNFHNREGEGKN